MKAAGTAASSKRSASFDELVWEKIRSIPAGKVSTYGAIARALGTGAYRRVGQACNRSPGMPDVPCHRVVASDGRLHGFGSGLDVKRDLLEHEGIDVTGSGKDMRLDLSRYEFELV